MHEGAASRCAVSQPSRKHPATALLTAFPEDSGLTSDGDFRANGGSAVRPGGRTRVEPTLSIEARSLLRASRGPRGIRIHGRDAEDAPCVKLS